MCCCVRHIGRKERDEDAAAFKGKRGTGGARRRGRKERRGGKVRVPVGGEEESASLEERGNKKKEKERDGKQENAVNTLLTDRISQR